MGYIDADTHIRECAHTWDFFDPTEEEYKPRLVNGAFVMQEVRIEQGGARATDWDKCFGEGTVDLTDPNRRVRYMDNLGVDVHVLFPTFFLSSGVHSAVAEAAMKRSYNRWLAERTAESGGRLRWAVNVPVRTIDRALEEIRFGRDNGAVAVFLKGFAYGMSVRDPLLLPIFDLAQDLDMPIAFHVGGEDLRVIVQDPGRMLHSEILPVPCAFGSLLQSGLCERYPRLRWAFVEAGAAWIPYVAQESFRALDIRGLGPNGWQEYTREAFEKYNLFVACQMDDDLTYLSSMIGQESLVHGTDFGHLDVGSDPNGLHIIASDSNVDPSLRKNIVDSVSRRLFGIDEDFCPAPPASVEGYAIESGQYTSASFLWKPAQDLSLLNG